ncbi:hypothetical protein [Cohnella candidum]|uniref:Pyridoxamine 5'-phosphate oxidase family protein n=1 Tax=Cohnella candidum TaxID=2674991 RepID=A0A3G3K1T7_9BACL|nr:hypothetical protein [Cohnella candidum]AYQ74340.1 hypothetical protein EAV92_18260 [Cohnella candidum]
MPGLTELSRFLERDVPKFIHLAAGRGGRAPFSCRAYACRPEAGQGREHYWIYVRESQWARVQEHVKEEAQMAVLLTSGVDNESYQIKGTYAGVRALNPEDQACLKREQHRIRAALPDMFAPPIGVEASECLAVGLAFESLYVQTPGPQAGAAIAERSRSS